MAEKEELLPRSIQPELRTELRKMAFDDSSPLTPGSDWTVADLVNAAGNLCNEWLREAGLHRKAPLIRYKLAAQAEAIAALFKNFHLPGPWIDHHARAESRRQLIELEIEKVCRPVVKKPRRSRKRKEEGPDASAPEPK